MDARRAPGLGLEAIAIAVAHDDLAAIQTDADFSTVCSAVWRKVRVVMRSVDVADGPEPFVVIFDFVSALERIPGRLGDEFVDRVGHHRLVSFEMNRF